MKNSSKKFLTIIAAAVLSLAQYGCLSDLLAPTADPTVFHVISPVQIEKKYDCKCDVNLQAAQLPQYMSRQQIVSLAESGFGNGGLVLAYRDRRVEAQLEHAALFAEGGADAARELGEIVGLGQDAVGFFPSSPEERVLEFRRAVAQGAGPVAERYSAVHAARGLELALSGIQGLFYFAEVGNSIEYRAVSRFPAGDG